METFFVVTAPGLEPLAAAELRGLGLLPPAAEGEPFAAAAAAPAAVTRAARASAASPNPQAAPILEGGVEFTGSFAALYRANLHLRTASRVLVRLGDFYAAAFYELRKKASRLPWERYLKPGQPVSMHVTCHKSRLYHSGAVAERVAGAIGDRLGRPSELLKAGEDAANPPQLIVVRILNDHCTISIDSSGELLHRRGYRQETAKAPLRETLAAAMLMAAGWEPALRIATQDEALPPLLDPFCGSGTIAIEAALMAMGLPPGMNRRFAFMDWPGFDMRRWQKSLEGIRPRPLAELPPILASDRDAGAIRIAQANAERAGVLEAIRFECKAVSAVEPPPGPGWVVTNPPYGLRVSHNQDLRNLYAQLGNVLRAKCPGWSAAILSSDVNLLRQTRLRLDTSFTMVNGGVKVFFGRGMVE